MNLIITLAFVLAVTRATSAFAYQQPFMGCLLSNEDAQTKTASVALSDSAREPISDVWHFSNGLELASVASKTKNEHEDGSSSGEGANKAFIQEQSDAPDAGPLIRKDFKKLGRFERNSFKHAITQMMLQDCEVKPGEKLELPCKKIKADNKLNKVGWKYQASIHGKLRGSTQQPAWNTCQHSSFVFLSWHRMELYFFERILRAWSGNNDLTLPYWNFTVADQDKAKECVADKLPPNCVGARLPAAFRVKPVKNNWNPFWWEFRDDDLNTPPPNAGNDKALPLCGTVVTTKKAFAEKLFFTKKEEDGEGSFGGGAVKITIHLPMGEGGGQIERVPHDMVHGAVGDARGEMSMADPDGAALDPIFWPIHANIDRAWRGIFGLTTSSLSSMLSRTRRTGGSKVKRCRCQARRSSIPRIRS